MFSRITFDLQIMGGRACIRGMRIPVSVIVGQIANGATTEEVLKGYRDLELEDIQQALEYAAWLTQEKCISASGVLPSYAGDSSFSTARRPRAMSSARDLKPLR